MWGCFFYRLIKAMPTASAGYVLIRSYSSLMNNDGLIIYTFLHTHEGVWSNFIESDATRAAGIHS